MTKKDAFIKLVQNEIFECDNPNLWQDQYEETYELAKSYWEEFKKSTELTAQGKQILLWMKNNKENLSNVFTSKEIAEALFTSGRVIAGSMRKLVADGYVEKEGKNPVQYHLTNKATDIVFEELEN